MKKETQRAIRTGEAGMAKLVNMNVINYFLYPDEKEDIKAWLRVRELMVKVKGLKRFFGIFQDNRLHLFLDDRIGFPLSPYSDTLVQPLVKDRLTDPERIANESRVYTVRRSEAELQHRKFASIMELLIIAIVVTVLVVGGLGALGKIDLSNISANFQSGGFQ